MRAAKSPLVKTIVKWDMDNKRCWDMHGNEYRMLYVPTPRPDPPKSLIRFLPALCGALLAITYFWDKLP
jgi:hypothetical protein